MAARITSTAKKTKARRCDICLKKDSWKGLCLQECRVCGVCVHEECYGLRPTKEKNPEWECWACQAVGTHVEGWTLKGKKPKVLTVEERSVECALCPVKDGIHAMHALFHDYGEHGKQLILPSYRKIGQRLAWVHTICAFGVCCHRATAGAVYGCDEDGDFDGSDDVLHHFVMAGLSPIKSHKEEDREASKILEDHRKLNCIICGHHEVTAGRNLRVPLQCCAGDKDEYREFKRFHKDMEEPCMQAMHVGCAMWKGSPNHRQMWYFPGSTNEGEDETKHVVGIYCPMHAMEMGATKYSIKASDAKQGTGSTILQRVPAEQKELELPPYAEANPTARRPSTHKSPSQATISPGSSDAHAVRTDNDGPGTAGGMLVLAHMTSGVASPTTSKPDGGGQKKHPSHSHHRKPCETVVPRDTTGPTPSSGAVEEPSDPKPVEASASREQANRRDSTEVSASFITPTSEETSMDHGDEGQEADDTLSPPSKRTRTESIDDQDEDDTIPVAMDDDAVNAVVDQNADDEGMWLDSSANGRVTGTVRDVDPPEGENPWAYLWEPDAPPFRIEVVKSTTRRNVERLVNSLRSIRGEDETR